MVDTQAGSSDCRVQACVPLPLAHLLLARLEEGLHVGRELVEEVVDDVRRENLHPCRRRRLVMVV